MNPTPRNPLVTVDVIIEIDNKIVLVRRRNPPLGWALPGGFVDYGEAIEAAAAREAQEETGLRVELCEQFHTYSHPDRDPRHHTATTVFIARAQGMPLGADDALEAALFSRRRLPAPIVFDHRRILDDYFRYRSGEPLQSIFKPELTSFFS